jgi:dolichol kinase
MRPGRFLLGSGARRFGVCCIVAKRGAPARASRRHPFTDVRKPLAILRQHPPDPQYQEASHPSEISMKSEVIRKSIHLSSIGIPLIYGLAGREIMLWLLVPVTIISLIVEFLRMRVPVVEAKLRRVFGTIMREHELREHKAKLSGATWVFLSATICVIVFPTIIAITGFTILIVSDTAAALFGRRFGRHRFLEKSLEGSGAFYVTAMMVVTIVMLLFDAPTIFLTTGAAAAFAATAAEAFSHGANIDDNLTIPTSYGIVQWALLALSGGPEVDRLWEFGRGIFG